MNEDPLKQNDALKPSEENPEEASDTPSLAPDPVVVPPDENPAEQSSPVAPTEPTAPESPAVPPTIPSQPEIQKPLDDELLLAAHASPDAPISSKRPMWLWPTVVIGGLIIAAGLVYGAYHVGNSRGYKSGKTAQTVSMTAAELKVPEHATMVAQCAEGEGTQYVLPSNIPQGPIYNVWNNKVTGIEFMLGQSKIASSKTLDLALMNQKYDHIDVMYEAAGHAGFTEPHYHVVLSMIPYAQEQKITCSGSSSTMSSMGM
ncbi:MAG: hypothetical protein ACQR33_04820 [Candidatus Saccharibacteria bacterium]